jgi:VanZ family protein
MRVKALARWIPALLWAAMILVSSGDHGSFGVTEGWVRRAFPSLSDEAVFFINYAMRKSGHVAAYAVMGALNLYAIRGWGGGWSAGAVTVAVGLAVLVAVLDENRQAAFSSRTGTLADVGFDFCGAALGQFVSRRGK